MATETLVYATDPTTVTAEVEAAGGRLIHALTANLLVIALPDTVSADSIRSASVAEPAALAGIERALAEAWLSRFGRVSIATERFAALAAEPPLAWDTPGYTPPDHVPGRQGPPAFRDDSPARSTNTPTSVTLTGSVAVGIVMVSGPVAAPTWTSVHGALKYVSVATDRTVWGVNAAGQIFWFSNGSWSIRSGALKQISAASASLVWGVNANDQIFRRVGAASDDAIPWQQVSGALKHVSAAADGTVWGVNRDDKIYRWNGSSWDEIAGRLKQISVGNATTVWGVNAADQIFFWTGSGWTRVAGALKHVSVATDGSVFGVNANDEIFQRSGSSWVQLSGRLKQLSVSSSSLVWGVNNNDQIYVNDPSLSLAFTAAEKSLIMSEVLQGLTFLATLDPSANVSFVQDWQDITVTVGPGAGDDYEDFEAPWRNAALQQMGFAASRSGSVAYVNSLRTSKQTNWAYVAYITKYPLYHFGYASGERLVMDYRNDGWGTGSIDRVFAHETCHIFGAADEYGDCSCSASGHNNVPNNNCRNCTSAQIACLMNANTLSLCSWSRGQVGWSPWEQIAGALKHVAVGQDGTVWGVNANDEIFRRDGSSWTRIAGALKQISVGDAGDIWGVNRNDEIFRRTGNTWTRVAGALKHVSVAADSTVWGVNANDEIFRRDGSSWTRIAGALKQISVGDAADIWGVNRNDEIFQRTGNTWTRVAGALKHVSVAADGTVWGVNANDQIYRRSGSSWEQVPGALKQVSTGAATLVWGVNRDDRIYRRK
jgi:hypothetical protein